MWAGLGDISGAVQNFVGTKYYVDALSALQKQGVSTPQGNQSKPLASGYSPQNNLNATTSDLLKNLQLNFPQ
jgi:hypothetical protein